MARTDKPARNSPPVPTHTQCQVQFDAASSSVKESVSTKRGIPQQQQRLTFSASVAGLTGGKTHCQDLRLRVESDNPLSSLPEWQVIVFQNDKSIGRLLHPCVNVCRLTDSPSLFGHCATPIQLITLEYNTARSEGLSSVPASPAAKPAVGLLQTVCLEVDDAFRASQYRLQIFGRHADQAFALPFPYCFSGSTVAAAVNQHQQRLEYRRLQHRRFCETSQSAPTQPAPSLESEECVVECGGSLQECALTFTTREGPPRLRRVVIQLAVIRHLSATVNDVTLPGGSSHTIAAQPGQRLQPSSQGPGVDPAVQCPPPTERGGSMSAKLKARRGGKAKVVSRPATAAAADLPSGPDRISEAALSTSSNVLSDMLQQVFAEEFGCFTAPVAPDAPSPTSEGQAEHLASTPGHPHAADSSVSSHPKASTAFSDAQAQLDGSDSSTEGDSEAAASEEGLQQPASAAGEAAGGPWHQGGQPPAGVASSSNGPLVSGVLHGSSSSNMQVQAGSPQAGSGEGVAHGHVDEVERPSPPAPAQNGPSAASAGRLADEPGQWRSELSQYASHQYQNGKAGHVLNGKMRLPTSPQALLALASAAVGDDLQLLAEQVAAYPHLHGPEGEVRASAAMQPWDKSSHAAAGLDGAAASDVCSTEDLDPTREDSSMDVHAPPAAPPCTSPRFLPAAAAEHRALFADHSQPFLAQQHSEPQQHGEQQQQQQPPPQHEEQQHPPLAMSAEASAAPDPPAPAAWAAVMGVQSRQLRQQRSFSSSNMANLSLPPGATSSSTGGRGHHVDWPVTNGGRSSYLGRQQVAGHGRQVAGQGQQGRSGGPSDSYAGQSRSSAPQPNVRRAVSHDNEEQFLFQVAEAELMAAAAAAAAVRGCATAPTDLQRLIQQVTPVVHLPDPSLRAEVTLADVWQFYKEPSLYGRDVFTVGGQRGPSTAYFVPSLSAVQLFTPADASDVNRRLYTSNIDGWPQYMHLKYEHFDEETPFNRMPLYEHMEHLNTSWLRAVGARSGATSVTNSEQPRGQAAVSAQSLDSLRVADLHPASWYAVAWYPIYRIPDAPLCARFLVFHSFAPLLASIQQQQAPAVSAPASSSSGQAGDAPLAILDDTASPHPVGAGSDEGAVGAANSTLRLEVPVVGLRWNNLMGERWLDSLLAAPHVEGGACGTQGDLAWDEAGPASCAPPYVPLCSDMSPWDLDAWQARLSELQATAERLARARDVLVLGRNGVEDLRQRHPDFEFFNLRG